MRATQKTALTDAQLVKQARAGESDAFDALVERHFNLVFAVARARLGVRESAEDLAQEVFVRAHLNIARLRDAKRFAPWLCQMTRNLAMDWLRRGQRRSTILPMIPLAEEVERTMQSPEKSPREALESREGEDQVREALDRLAPDAREIVLLHFAEELSQRDIAKRLGISHATVSRRLSQALDTMRGALAPEMRDPKRGFRPSRGMATRTAAVIAALSASAEVKASVSTAIAAAPTAAEVTGSVSSASGILAGIKSLLISGGQIMAWNKGATALTVVAIAAVGGVAVNQMGGDSSSTPAQQSAAGNGDSAAIMEFVGDIHTESGEELKALYMEVCAQTDLRRDPYGPLKAVLSTMTTENEPEDLAWLFPPMMPRFMLYDAVGERVEPELFLQSIRGREVLNVQTPPQQADGNVVRILYVDPVGRQQMVDTFFFKDGLMRYLMPNVPNAEWDRVIDVLGYDIQNNRLVSGDDIVFDEAMLQHIGELMEEE